jgi:DNA repair exonuclease SbcCD ATPase subunit
MPQRYSYVKPGRTDSILLPTAYGKHLDNVSSKELDESIEVEADIIPPLASTGSEARSDIDATEDLVKDDERGDDDGDVDADINYESVDEIAQMNFLQDLVEAKGEEYLTAIDTIEDNVAVEDEQEENDDAVSDINNDIIVKHDVVEVTDAESPMEIDTINVTVDDEQVNDVVVVDINNEPVAEAQEDEDHEDEAQEDVDVQSDVEVKDKEEECSNMEVIHDVECVKRDDYVVVAAEDIQDECVIKAQENVVVEVTDNEVKDSNDACVADVGVIEVTDKEVEDSNDTCVIKNQEIVQFRSVVEVTDKEVKVSNDACVKDVDVDSKTDVDSNTEVDTSTDVDTNTDSGIIDVDTQEEASDLEVGDEKEEVGEISCDSNDVNANENEESLIKANKELMGTVNELMTTVEYLKAMIDIHQLSDNSSPFDRIRMLEDDVTVKSATIDLLTDKIVSLDEKIQQISMLEEELTVTRAAIDEMAVDINRTITSFEKKTAENADLAKQLQLSKSKNEELEAEVQTMAHKYEAAKLVTAKNFPTFAEVESRKAEVESLTASNKECVEKVTMLETALAAKKCTIDDLIAEMNRKNKKLQEKSDEISDINERLEIFKAKNKGLEAEHPILVDKIKVFESDLAAKKVVVDDLSIVIQQKNKLLEEKSAKIADISNQLQIYKDVCDEFETKVESLVADNNEHIENISKLKEDLAAKTNLIEELKVETEQNAALKEKLQDAQAENDGLKKAVEALFASSKENIEQISFLESDLAAKSSIIDSINEDLQNKNA